jgi:hypothetical protein
MSREQFERVAGEQHEARKTAPEKDRIDLPPLSRADVLLPCRACGSTRAVTAGTGCRPNDFQEIPPFSGALSRIRPEHRKIS